MTDLRLVSLLVEGLIDEQVLRKLIRLYTPFTVDKCNGHQGISYIQKRIRTFAHTATPDFPVICLIDLDRHPCAVELKHTLIGEKDHPGFILRIAVTELEAWLLADRENMAMFLGAPLKKISDSPDSYADPKKELITLARKYAKQSLKKYLLPNDGSDHPVGRGYTTQIQTFIVNHWSPESARKHSPSLERAIRALTALSDTSAPES